MKTSVNEAIPGPGIISVPDPSWTGSVSCPKYLITAVPDIQKFMQENGLYEAFVIYHDTFAEATRFRDELYENFGTEQPPPSPDAEGPYV